MASILLVISTSLIYLYLYNIKTLMYVKAILTITNNKWDWLISKPINGLDSIANPVDNHNIVNIASRRHKTIIEDNKTFILRFK